MSYAITKEYSSILCALTQTSVRYVAIRCIILKKKVRMIESGCYTQLSHQTEWHVIDVFDFVVSFCC